MITIRIIRKQGSERVEARQGVTLAEILRLHGSFDLPCGGKGWCLGCRVRAEGGLSPVTEKEREAFSSEEIARGWRLACLTRAEGDVTLHIPEATERIRIDGFVPEFPLDPLYRRYGLAADIGTTTLCMHLYGPDGLCGGTARKNPQTAYGADVISRIKQSLDGQSAPLAESVRTALAEMAAELAEKSNIRHSEIDGAVLTGNTAMLYLLTGQCPETLSHAPFEADRLFGEFIPAELLFPGLGLNPSVEAYLPRCMSAFVGADITTALLTDGLCGKSGIAFLIDIGTNGEIALWNGENLLVCSTAAGPAFEGAGLRCGMYGADGAVDRIWLENGTVRYSTIGGKRPAGICGSGAVDALSVMLESGIIDETGAFQNAKQFDITQGVFLTDEDVRKLQLAKGAIRAGMETLLLTAKQGWDNVAALDIAGGFGSYLNLRSAAAIGLLPEEVLNRTRVLGNAALTGASMILQNQNFVEESCRLANSAQTVSLESSPAFLNQFMDHLLFG